MPGVIDTNILLYAVNTDAAEHDAARELLLRAGRVADAWYLTEGIVYEFLRVATHPKVFPSPLGAEAALSFVDVLIRRDNVHVLSAGTAHWSILASLLAEIGHPSGNLMFDIRTVALMREHGVGRIYSADTDLLQFRDIEVVNPVKRR